MALRTSLNTLGHAPSKKVETSFDDGEEIRFRYSKFLTLQADLRLIPRQQIAQILVKTHRARREELLLSVCCPKFLNFDKIQIFQDTPLWIALAQQRSPIWIAFILGALQKHVHNYSTLN